MKLLLVMLFPMLVCAEQEISLSRAIDMAIKTSDDIKIKKSEEYKSKYQYYEALGALMPQIKLESTWTHSLDIPTAYQIGDPSKDLNPLAKVMKIANKYDFNNSLSLSQPLMTFGKISNGIKAAKQGHKASKLGVKVTKREVIYQTKLAYYSVILSERLLEISKLSLKNAKTNKTLLRSRFSSGRPPQSDLIKLEADIASRIPEVRNSENRLESATLNLKMLLDLDKDDEIKLISSMHKVFPQYELDLLSKSMEKDEPTLKMIDASVTASELFVKMKRAGYFPTIGAFANYSYFGSSPDKVLADGNSMDGMFSVGVQLSIPIWTGGKIISQFEQAVADRNTAYAKQRKALKGFTLQLENAFSQYKMYLAIYDANKHAKDMAKKSFRMSQNRFKTGNTTVSELNDAERMVTGAQMQTEMTLFNVNKVMAQLELLAGEKL